MYINLIFETLTIAIVKKQLHKILIINILLIFFAGGAYAQTTYVWTGAAGSAGVGDWTNIGNWTVGGGPAADYPGHVGATDIVDIGVPGVAGPSDTTFVFTNQPTLATGVTVNVASLTFGNNNAPTGTITLNGDGTTTTNTIAGTIILTVNGTLNVTGTVLQMHSPTGGGANSGTTTPAIHSAGTTTTSEYTSLLGAGTLHCGYFTMGDNTLPSHDEVSNVTVLLIGGIVTNLAAVAPHTVTNPVESNITINIDHDFTMNTISYSNPAGTLVSPGITQVVITRNSDARMLFFQGTFNIGGMFNLTNSNATPAAGFKLFQRLYKPQNKLSIRPESDASFPANWVTHPAKFFYGGPFITFGNPSDPDYLNCVNKIDFYDNSGGITAPPANTNVNTSIVNYNGNNNQLVYSDSDTTHVDIGAYTYSQLIISGSGVKTVRPNGNYTPALTTPGLTVNETLLVTNLNTPGLPPTVFDLATNNANLWESGAYQTDKNTIVNTGSGYINLSSQGYTNNGTSNFGTGLVTYNSGNSPTFHGNGVTNYTNVKFINGTTSANSTLLLGNNAINDKGTYNILSTGVMQIALHGTGSAFSETVSPGTATLNFLSDANGSATLATLLGTCAVTGNVNVQRYISGGAGSRGYRLLSSQVNTGAVDPDGTGNKIFSLNYLMNSTFESGTTGAAGGFDASPLNNPSLYLYRENLSPLNTSFLNSNYRGVMDLNNNPGYHFNSDAVNIESPGLRYLPIGNGFLMYFRGSRATPTPFVAGSLALAATLTATGALNQGNITVADWYTPGSPNLGYTTSSGSATIEGANLVGNPYPAAIDWSTYSATSTGAGIYAPNVGPFIYMLLPGNKAGAGNYAIWSKTTTPTNGATSIIASGEGFFVYALPPTVTNPTSSITFTEGAKVNTSPGPATFLAKIPASARVPVAVPQYLLLKAALDSINSDEMLINFRNDAKAAYDPMEDARYKTGTGKVNLGSISSDNVALAINSMPLAPKGQTIPLKINASATGTYTLNTEEIKNIPQLYDVWLKDAYTKDSVDMRKTPSYSFTITLADTNSFGAKRFSIVINPNPALAYKLTSFTASQVINKEQVQLAWKTANEQNTTQFAVERSTDLGKTFDTLNTKTSDDSGSYSFLDQEPNSDNLYRLRQQDVTGNVTRSSVLEVLITDRPQDAVSINVYPNPVVSNLTLTIKPRVVETNVTYRIKVSNSSGLVVKQVITPNTSWQDNISNLQLGTYLVQVLNNSDNSVVGETKFVKL